MYVYIYLYIYIYIYIYTHTHIHTHALYRYSTSRTCEIQLSNATGTHFKSIMYLLDKCSRPLSQ